MNLEYTNIRITEHDVGGTTRYDNLFCALFCGSQCHRVETNYDIDGGSGWQRQGIPFRYGESAPNAGKHRISAEQAMLFVSGIHLDGDSGSRPIERGDRKLDCNGAAVAFGNRRVVYAQSDLPVPFYRAAGAASVRHGRA